MKIGIITLFGLYNYGNRLQNLAVSQIIANQGYEAETIVCSSWSIRTLIKHFLGFVCFFTKESRRKKAFIRFNKKYIKSISIKSKNAQIPTTIDEFYQYFVVGSDQVWNPEIRKKERNNFFLQFTTKNKRICLAPSIGVTKIGRQYEEEFRYLLQGFKILSCREQEGSAEIQRLTQKSCEHLIDPTLALDKGYWKRIENSNDLPTGSYVLSIFIGEKSGVAQKYMDFYRRKGFNVIDLLNKKDKYYIKGPEYFISLIEHAYLVLTDSFHAVAFSINFNTNFFVFDRGIVSGCNMLSRIQSLLRVMKLENRLVNENTSYSEVSVDFTTSNIILEKERGKFYNYVNKVIPLVH